MNIGARLRAIRKDKKLTQKKLSKISGISTNTISKMENNKMSPSTKLLEKWAKSVGVQISEIYCYTAEIEATVDEQQLMMMYRRLSESDRANVLRLLRSMQR